ncbi:MAG TPA: hypothetical protein VE569_01430, partial [Acidimicrobiia bacterium]|nr:hypothetical protein [Acidimicrobiia bacterium]
MLRISLAKYSLAFSLSAHHRKYVGVSTASDAACFVLVLDAPLRVRRRRRVLAIDAAASPK